MKKLDCQEVRLHANRGNVSGLAQDPKLSPLGGFLTVGRNWGFAKVGPDSGWPLGPQSLCGTQSLVTSRSNSPSNTSINKFTPIPMLGTVGGLQRNRISAGLGWSTASDGPRNFGFSTESCIPGKTSSVLSKPGQLVTLVLAFTEFIILLIQVSLMGTLCEASENGVKT